jgi:U4/U6 small nuclear ribonucleoprotein PRP3
LSDPSHRFKITKNAQQDGLTGLCLIHPNFALVYAEGGVKGMKHYTRLLEHRIDWTQSATQGSDEEEMKGNGPSPEAGDGKNAGLAGNRCDLIWKGAISEHAFRNFKTKNVPTDNAAKELLGSQVGPVVGHCQELETNRRGTLRLVDVCLCLLWVNMLIYCISL